MAQATIVEASLFTNRQNGTTSAWFKFDDGGSQMMNLAIAQGNLDAALMAEDSDLTLLEGCEVTYDARPTIKGEAFINDKGTVVTGPKAGIYDKPNPKRIINFTIDYTEAKIANREVQAIGRAIAKRREAKADLIASVKAGVLAEAKAAAEVAALAKVAADKVAKKAKAKELAEDESSN
jgi:hypothetical protein